MNQKKNILVLILILLLLIVSKNLYSQSCLPDSRRVDWTKAGLLPGTDHSVDHWIFIDDYSGSDYEKIMAALADANNQSGNSVIYFQSAEYHITQKIDISFNQKSKEGNVVFLGNLSPDTLTTLSFEGIDKDANCIKVRGYWRNEIADILNDVGKGDRTILFDDHSNIYLEEGDWIKFCEPNFDDNYSGSNAEFIGQMTQITSYSNGEITIKDDAAKNYSISNNMWLKEFRPTKNIGFEKLKIQRDNSAEGNGTTLNFDMAVNCWLYGVEFYNCTGYHVQINHSAHCSINGCYMHKATNYDSSPGTGYGVVLHYATSNCLVENNVFRKTRHAMLVGRGANCNVFDYNYSREAKWDDSYELLGWNPGDIRLHGRYAFANLFEGNSVDYILADDTHGDNGPYNTFLRNKVRDDDLKIQYADTTNVFTNYIKGSGTFVKENSSNVLRDNNCPDISYIYDSKPSFFTNPDDIFPPYETNSQNNKIPADVRWEEYDDDEIISPIYHNAPNFPPVVSNPISNITVNEDASDRIIDLSNVFWEPNNTALTLQVISNSNSNLVTTSISDNNLRLSFKSNKSGTSTLRIQATSEGKSVTDEFVVQVNSVNDPPTGSNSTISIPEDSEYYFRNNDFPYTDIENQQLAAIKIITLPAKGTFRYNESTVAVNQVLSDIPSLYYIPEENGSGIPYSNFSYQLIDAGGAISKYSYQLTINVDNEDDPPIVISPILDISIDEDSPAIAYDLNAVFTDIDNDDDQIVESIVSNSNTSVVKASIARDSLLLEFYPNISGEAEIIIKALSNGKTVRDTFHLEISPINDAPFGEDSEVNFYEDSISVFMTNYFPYSDIENDEFKGIKIISLPNKGNLKYRGLASTNNQLVYDLNLLTFEPQHDSIGNSYASFQYMLIDILGSMSDSAYTMTINIENIDDPPFIKNPLPDITINEDSIGVFLELIDVFDDIDSEISQIEIFSNNNDTLVNPVILNDTLFLELHTNRFGNAQVIVEAESNFKSVNDTFIINVLSVNDPPIGENSEVSIHEDSIYAFKAEDFPYSDIENDDLHGIIIKSLPNKGVFLYNNFAVNLNEMIIDFTQLSFQPEKDSIGIQYSSFSFDLVDIQNGISDSSYSMTINVLEVDDAPILIKPIPDIELIEDGPDSTMDLTEYFFDPENDSIFFSITYISDTNLIIADIVNDTTINISLKANQFGTTDIAIMGQSNLLTVTDTLSIEILSINDPPLGADSLVYGFEDSTHIFQKSDFPFFDIEDDSLIALYIRSLPQKGELLYDSMPVGFDQRINTINQLTFRPEPESMGESYTQFKYKLVDQHEAISNSSYTMTINILAVDDPPFVKNPFSDLILSEDSIGVFLVLDSLFSDIDNADSLINISLKSVSDSTLLEAEIHQDNLEIFLKENAFGSAEVMLEGLSNFKSVLDTFLITVLPVNDSPFGKDTSVVIYEDSTYHFSKKEFPFSDIEDDSLASIHLVTIPTKGRLEYDGELVNPETVVADFYELTFTPEKDSIGMNYTEFQFRLTDDDGAISDSIYKITINVLEIDDPPVIQNPITDIYLLEDAMDTLINISEVFSDPDSGDLTYSSIKNSNPNLVNIKLLDSILTFNLNENQNGKSEILLSAISNDFTITDTFWIFVEAVNDIPSDFTLFLPVNNDTIDLALHESITFSWEESFDPDFNEDVSYRIAINDTNYLSEDTTFTISTEQYKLQNEKNLELLWHVDAFSNHDTIKSSGTYGLILRNIPLAIAEEQTPKTFKLLQNYPNPFNPVTTLPYLLPKMSDISIMIYNSQGRLIDTYFMRNQPAGYHEYLWNAANFPSGLYFFKFTAGNYIDIKKCLLLK